MFDFGFTEMMVVAVVGLIVLGPERLPRVAKQAGQWLGKLQRYVADVKSDINRQMELDELRRMQSEVTQAAHDIESSLNKTISETQSHFDSITSDLGSPASDPTPSTDWDKVYANRRVRDRIRDRRIEREKVLGVKRPKRRLH